MFDCLTIFIGAILIFILAFYYTFKLSYTFVPIEIFLEHYEKIRFCSLAVREDLGGRGSGMCFLTNKRLIFLPTYSAREYKEIFEFFLPLSDITRIKISSPYNHIIFTRTDSYEMTLQDRDIWKKYFNKIKNIDVTKYYEV